MAVAQFVVTVEYTPLEGTTLPEVENELQEAISNGISTGGPTASVPPTFIVDQYEVAAVVGGSLANPKG